MLKFLVTSVLFPTMALAQTAAPTAAPIDTGSDNIRVLRAEVTDIKIADISAKDADAKALKVDVNGCKVHEKLPKGVRFDCTSEVSKLIALPMAKRVFIDSEGSAAPYKPLEFYCSVIKLDTITRTKVLASVKEIGFYIDYQFVNTAVADLVKIDQMTMADGEEGTIHQFGVVHRCANEANPKTYQWSALFKPYLLTELKDKLYRDWDNAPTDYKMFEQISTIDRTDEIIDGIMPTPPEETNEAETAPATK